MYTDSVINNIQRLCIEYNNGKKDARQVFKIIQDIVFETMRLQMKGSQYY